MNKKTEAKAKKITKEIEKVKDGHMQKLAACKDKYRQEMEAIRADTNKALQELYNQLELTKDFTP
jgi:ElaB/YqjD/DUF883 family membrane-anchored ribosome-binding protein